jgi:L-threonylcarbamoyladenylate synthase
MPCDPHASTPGKDQRMNVLRVDPQTPDPAELGPAVDALRQGRLVAFPTETVYGLGAHALDPAAVGRIYAAKGRPGYNPLIVHSASAAAARALASEWPSAAEALAEAFWPGPLTLVVPRAPGLPDAVTAGLSNVGLRVPAHPVAQALLTEAGIPVAAPSANRSTELSPTTAEHVIRSLGDRVDWVIDGGTCPVGIESTVVSVAGPVPTILRPGSITQAQLADVLGLVVAAPSGEGGRAGGGALPSPGQMDRHYAPRAALRVIEPGEESVLVFVQSGAMVNPMPMQLGGRSYDAKTAVLTRGQAEYPGARMVRMPADPQSFGAMLYATLHELDDLGVERILVERVPDGPEWDAVRDRLRRASHGSG